MQLVVICNLINISTDQYPINEEAIISMERWNIVFTSIYIFEILVKLGAYGLKNYFLETNFHIFDILIGLLSFLDVLISQMFLTTTDDLSNSGIITILKFFRALRLFKLARYWRSFKILLYTLWMTIINLYSFTCLLIIVIFSYALLGLEFFAN